jgi:hypothetical protein
VCWSDGWIKGEEQAGMILYRRHGRFDLDEDKLLQGHLPVHVLEASKRKRQSMSWSVQMQRLVTEIEGVPTLEEQDVPYRAARTARCFRSIAAVSVSPVVVVAMRRHVGKDYREAFTCLGPFWISTNLHMPLPLRSLRYFLFDQSQTRRLYPNIDGRVRRTIKLSPTYRTSYFGGDGLRSGLRAAREGVFGVFTESPTEETSIAKTRPNICQNA